MNSEILIIYDERDYERVEHVSKGNSHSIVELINGELIGLNTSHNIAVSYLAIDLDFEKLNQHVLNNNKLERLNKAIDKADIVVVIVSSLSISNLELEKAFKDKAYKIILSFRYRACLLSDCNWLENSEIYPEPDKTPYLEQNELERQETLKGFIVELRRLFDTKLKKPFEEKPKSKKPLKTRFSVFISYSRKDGDFADLLKHKLKAKGIKVYIDTSMFGGEEWKKVIDDYIEKANIVLLVASPHSSNSGYVIYEWSYALANKKDVVPILTDKIEEWHPKLKDLNIIDFSQRENRKWKKVFKTIQNYEKIFLNQIGENKDE